MLTDGERAWLKKKERILREGKVWGAWCYACPNFGRDWAECYAHQYCPIFNSHEALQDAAEFEARVAAKLALGCESQTPCNGCWRANWKFCNLRKGYWDCADCFLKTARLIVEEEMDGNNTM